MEEKEEREEREGILRSLLLKELGELTHFDEVDSRIAKVLESAEQKHLVFDPECVPHQILVKALKHSLGTYSHVLWPRPFRLLSTYLRKLNADESGLMIFGVNKESIDSFRNALMKAIKLTEGKTLKEIRKRATDPFIKAPKAALTYHVAKSIQEVFADLSQSGALRTAIFLFKEFDIEPDKIIRWTKKKVSRADSVFNRLEQRLIRFKREFGNPETIYSRVTKLFATK